MREGKKGKVSKESDITNSAFKKKRKIMKDGRDDKQNEFYN